jgi:leucyl aminopeptidase
VHITIFFQRFLTKCCLIFSLECYVADEIITSRAKVRVRVGNTDAEGRMVMTDVLCYMKEQAREEVNPHLFTIATLTGHSIRAMGPHYSVSTVMCVVYVTQHHEMSRFAHLGKVRKREKPSKKKKVFVS